jgi:hypothetical protein
MKPNHYKAERVQSFKGPGVATRLVFKGTGKVVAEVVGPATRKALLKQFADQVAAYEMELICAYASGGI